MSIIEFDFNQVLIIPLASDSVWTAECTRERGKKIEQEWSQCLLFGLPWKI